MIYLYSIFLVFFIYNRSKFLMLFFQQEEYKIFPFFDFTLKKFQLIDKRFTILLFTLFSICDLNYFLLFTTIILAIFGLFYEKDPYNKTIFKKPLVLTNRVKRIWFLNLSLSAIFLIPIISITTLNTIFIYSLALVISQPFLLIISNIFLIPLEIMIRRSYRKEAESKLKKLKPFTIGITGSFGKTSLKHIIGHLLRTGFKPTYFTPGSVNTLMGLTRVIREKLLPFHKYFIAELGTGQMGRMKKLCALTQPKIGILTAIGNAHFNFFKTQNNLAKEKFELAKSVLKQKDGFLILNTLHIDKKYIEQYVGNKKDQILLLTRDKNSFINYPNKAFLTSTVQTSKGIQTNLHYKGKVYNLNAPIFGIHQAENMALAYLLSLKIGGKTSILNASLKSLPQITHRFEKKSKNPIIIDDAFNSNPTGFSKAIETLQIFKTSKKSRLILITPGMVELGKDHKKEHFKVGKKAGEIIDIVLLVRADRFEDFEKGFKLTAKNKQIIKCATLKEAQIWLRENQKKEDVILYENDLPDTFEPKIYI